MATKKKAKKKTPTKKAKAVKAPKLSYDTQTMITVFLLVTVYPIGLVTMFKWMKWPVWLRVLVLSPLIFLGVIIFVAIVAAVIGIKYAYNL